MKSKLLLVIVVFLLSQPFEVASAQEGTNRGGRQSGESARNSQEQKGKELTPVAIKDGVVSITPENTKVDFVGTHVGDQPNPRLGGFAKFSGKIELGDDGKTPKSISVEFQTDSVWTTIPDLTAHLKNADFLNVEKHATAKFTSNEISKTETPGVTNVKGDFTLLGQTKEISFPAKWVVNDKGITLETEFKLDRTNFGMSKMVERVSKAVAITVKVGQKTTGTAGQAGGMQGRRQGRGQGRRQFDPAQLFARMDANKDGKIEGDEINERMKDRITAMDADKNGSVSKEEFMKGMESMRSGGGRNRGGRGGN